MRVCPRLLAMIVTALPLMSSACTTAPPANDLVGSWRADAYDLAGGEHYSLTGQIMFSESDWTVTFFVNGNGVVARGSAEGGSYLHEAEGRVVLHHQYNLSFGEELPGLPASPFRMQVHGENGIAEPCRYQLSGNRLRLFFPSGNSMLFRRSSR